MLMARKVWRDLAQRPLSLAALVLVACIGVGCYTGMHAVARDLRTARDAYYARCRLAHFTIDVKRAPASVEGDLRRIVPDLEGRVSLPVRLQMGEAEMVTGVAVSLPRTLNRLVFTAGTWPRAGEALLIDAFARARGLRPGDRVRVVLMDEVKTFVVAGLVMSPEFVYVLPPGGGIVPDAERTPIVYLPLRQLQESGDLDGAFNQIVGRTDDPSPATLSRLLTRLEERLEPYGVALSTPWDEQASVRFLANELKELQTTGTVVPTVCLFVVAFVLNVVLRRLVAQQQIVIGTLRAMGWSRMSLVAHYAAYGLCLGVPAGVGGVALGAWLQRLMLGEYERYFAIPGLSATTWPDVIAAGLAVAVLASLAGTFAAVRFAVGLQPAVAMRALAPDRGGRSWLDHVPWVMGRMSFRTRMMVRAISRNPFRSLVTVCTTLVATALMVETLGMVSGIHFMVDHAFSRVARQDLSIGLRDPVSRQAVHEVSGMPAIEGVEPQLAVACDLSHGPWRKRTGVTGMPPRPRLYTPIDARDRPVPIPERGLVLDRKLADILHAGVGDVLTLRPLIGERRETRAPVVSIVDTYMGLSAYADARYVARLIGEVDAVDFLMARVRPGASQAALLARLDEAPAVLSAERRTRALGLIRAILDRSVGTSLLILLGFAGLVAFGGILNTALVSLSERQREVGTLRVLGYSTWGVLRIFSGESVLLNGVGTALGLAGGIWFTKAVMRFYDTEMFRMPGTVMSGDLLTAAGLMAGFVALAQVVVLMVVRRTDWLAVFKVRE